MDVRRAAMIAIPVVLVLGAIAAIVFWPQAPSGPKTPIVTIDSQPSGARVRIDGSDVGQTPYYSDNRYAPGPVKVLVSLKGYRDWSGSFDGGQEAVLVVPLVKVGPVIALDTVSVGVKPVPDAGAETEWHDPDLDNDPK